MKEKDKTQQATSDYGIIFKWLENDEEQNEVKSLRQESEEINELRKMVLEVIEPNRQYITASNIPAEQPPSINLHYSN